MKKPFFISLMMGMLMVSSAVLTVSITPRVEIASPDDRIDLETLIPREFDGWKVDSTFLAPIVNPDAKSLITKIYNQTLSRTYINNQSERVMLSIAYGRDQRTDLQIHRPEICYLANGFTIGALTKTFFDTTIGRIPVMHLVAKQGTRNEPITYWVRMGDSVTRGWFEQKLARFRYLVTGKVPDALLFRVSTISDDVQDSYRRLCCGQ